jgi:aminodeoxyfutalosine deaminase
MAFITAERIHNGNYWLPAGTTIEVANDGRIIAVLDAPNKETVVYDGVLAPGFVNVHCHLELSHMKGFVPPHTGLIAFLKNIPMHRNDLPEDAKAAARLKAYNDLLDNGVVAVGDIANTADTLNLRSLDKLHIYTFVETIGFSDVNAPRSFENALKLYNAFSAQEEGVMTLKQAIVPHAPYSVSSSLFRLIDMHRDDVIISIHNQETEEENTYYTIKEGQVRELLHSLGVDDSFFNPTGKSSLQSYLEWMSPHHAYIFVHNTYTHHLDVQYAHSRLNNVFWCLCPKANLYIENTLPDINMFISEDANICIGTDSLVANDRLSIMSEIYTVKQRYPKLDWAMLLSWATSNGAKALQLEDEIGTIEPGKIPGIVQIIGLDSGDEPTVKRIF